MANQRPQPPPHSYIAKECLKDAEVFITNINKLYGLRISYMPLLMFLGESFQCYWCDEGKRPGEKLRERCLRTNLRDGRADFHATR